MDEFDTCHKWTNGMRYLIKTQYLEVIDWPEFDQNSLSPSFRFELKIEKNPICVVDMVRSGWDNLPEFNNKMTRAKVYIY